MNEQLALIGASDHQMHFTHAHYGVLEFYPTRTNEWKETCRRCLLWNSPECKDAPCSAFESATIKRDIFQFTKCLSKMEIIKKGKQVLHYRGQCPNCKTIFRGKYEELCNVTSHPLYAYCPECNHLTTMRVETPEDFIGNK